MNDVLTLDELREEYRMYIRELKECDSVRRSQIFIQLLRVHAELSDMRIEWLPAIEMYHEEEKRAIDSNAMYMERPDGKPESASRIDLLNRQKINAMIEKKYREAVTQLDMIGGLQNSIELLTGAEMECVISGESHDV